MTTKPRMSRVLYFGALLDPRRLRRYCPAALVVGRARLPDYQLAFTRYSRSERGGVADIVPQPGASVWGALYELDEQDLPAIDRKEGYDWAYTREPLAVELCGDGSEHLALTYTVRRKEPTEVRPSPEYLAGLIDAGRELGLPEGYLRFLDRLRKRFSLEAQ